MTTIIHVRPSTPNDAEGILLAYHSAVHETAAKDYEPAVLSAWSSPVDAERIAKRRLKMETDTSIVSFVAVDDSGKVLGFGELVPPETLGAIYVAAHAGRQGVATSLYKTLETKARELGMKVLRMDSSLTAVPFYTRHGFKELGKSSYQMGVGITMASVKMEKNL